MTNQTPETNQANLEQFIAAGRKVFSTIGFDSSTDKDIIEASNLPEESFYSCFKGKGEVFEAVVLNFAEPMSAALAGARREAKTAHDFLFNAFDICRALPKNDPESAALINRNQAIFRDLFYLSNTENTLREDLRYDLKQGQENGMFVSIDEKGMADVMISLALDLVAQEANHPSDDSSRVQFLVDLFLPRLTQQ